MLVKRLANDNTRVSRRTDESGANRHAVLQLVRLLMVIGLLAFASNARAVLISFETSEGFPDGDGADFTGSANPAGIVDAWSPDALTNAVIDHGPGGLGFGDEPNPLSGSQIGLFSAKGNSIPGTNSVTLDLNNSAKLSLVSLWYANRGTFPPVLTLEYFGLDEVSLGSESFSGSTDGGVGLGLNAGFAPEFDLVTVSLPAAVGTPLSKVIITSTTTSTFSGHGSFSLEDITLSTVIPEPASLTLLLLAGMAVMMVNCRHDSR